MLKAARALPFARILAAAQVAMLARRHLRALAPAERSRMFELVRHARRLTPAERRELRELAGKLDARAFATGAARTLSPLGGGLRRGRR
jgi:hypothetical protein